jgi:hypothetical protein
VPPAPAVVHSRGGAMNVHGVCLGTYTVDVHRTRPRGRPRRSNILVGMTAGEVATVPAMALRAAPIQLTSNGTGGPAALADSAAAYDGLLQQAAAGEIILDVDPVPLAHVEKTWQQAGSDRRIVFVP